MGIMDMSGQRGKDETNKDSHSDTGKKAEENRQPWNLHHLSDDGGEARPVQSNVNIAPERGLVVFCIQENAG